MTFEEIVGVTYIDDRDAFLDKTFYIYFDQYWIISIILQEIGLIYQNDTRKRTISWIILSIISEVRYKLLEFTNIDDKESISIKRFVYFDQHWIVSIIFK